VSERLFELMPVMGAGGFEDDDKAERPAVVTRIVGEELMQIAPVLPVEAGDIGSIEVGEGGSGHGRPFLRLTRRRRFGLGASQRTGCSRVFLGPRRRSEVRP
jgi:hypothetical protein